MNEGVGDRGSGNGERMELDPALDDMLASLVTPKTRVDLRDAVLRRIEEERESAAAGWLRWNWRLATMAAAAVVVMATSIVVWRSSGRDPASTGRTAEIRGSAPATSPTPTTEAPREFSTVERVAMVPEPVRSTRASVRRPAPVTDASELENVHALPALEAPPPLRPAAMTTEALQVQTVEAVAPIEIAPLQIEQIEVDRPGTPK